MKHTILLLLLVNTCSLFAQHSFGTYYVAQPTALSMRETSDSAAIIVGKIPYGTKVTTVDDGAEWKSVDTEGMTGYWKKVKYNNRFGYIIDSYLFPWPPPRGAVVKEMTQYLVQAGIPFGKKFVVKDGTNDNESGWKLCKHLYIS